MSNGIDINRRIKITQIYYQNSSPEIKTRYPDFVSFKKAFDKALKTQKREIRILNATLPITKEELLNKDDPEKIFKAKYKLTKLKGSKKNPHKSRRTKKTQKQVSYPEYIPTPIEKCPKLQQTLFDHLEQTSKSPSPFHL